MGVVCFLVNGKSVASGCGLSVNGKSMAGGCGLFQCQWPINGKWAQWCVSDRDGGGFLFAVV